MLLLFSIVSLFGCQGDNSEREMAFARVALYSDAWVECYMLGVKRFYSGTGSGLGDDEINTTRNACHSFYALVRDELSVALGGDEEAASLHASEIQRLIEEKLP